MATTARVKTWVSGDTLTAADLNAEFNNLLTGGINNIQDANVASGAAIATSKIAGTAATLSGTETLTNKTLTNPTVNSSTQALTTDTDGATVTFDLNVSNIHSVTLGGNRTLALSNSVAGKVFVLRLIQDATGSRTVTWFSTIHWVGGVVPTLTTTAAHWDTFAFICTATNVYDGYVVGQNLS